MENYYNQKSIHYGIGHTRLKKILKLAGSITGKRIMDVGCSRGYLGRRFRENENYVAGIEISPQAAKEAEKVLDKVYIFNIEEKWPEEINVEKFDLVILAEVLEHIFDPGNVLNSVISILKEKGEIIITVPNFLSWINRLKIFFGFFKYTEQGLLDFGHIRFFTYNYLKQILAEAGLRVVEENHIIFPGKLTFFLKLWPSLFANQFIIKAQKI